MVDVETLKLNFETGGLSKAIGQLEDLASSLDDVASSLTSVEAMDDDVGVDVHGRRDLKRLNDEIEKFRRKSAFSAFTSLFASGSGATAGMSTPTPDGGGATATPDGGESGGGTPGFDVEELRELRDDLFGNAFDESGILRAGGQVTDAEQVISGSLGDRLNRNRLLEALAAGDIERSDLDTSDIGNIRKLLNQDILDLPEKGLLNRFQQFVENLDATTFNNVIAKLIPLLATFVAALPAAIGGVVALGAAALSAAGALAAVGGLAVLGTGFGADGFSTKRIVQSFSQLRKDVLDALAPLAQQFAPLFEAGLDGLVSFINALVDRSAILVDFKSLLGDLGQFLIREVPKALQMLAQLGMAAVPIFEQIAGALDTEELVEGMASFLADVVPTLAVFGSLLVRAIPPILKLSTGFLIATNAVIGLVGFLGQLINLFGIFGNIVPLEILGALLGLLLSAITIEAILGTTTALLTNSYLALAGKGIASAITSIAAYIKSIFTAQTLTIGFTRAVYGLVGALTALAVAAGVLGVLNIAIGAIGSALVQGTSGFSTSSRTFRNFRGASSRLRNFSRTGGRGGASRGRGTFVDVTNNIKVSGGSSPEEQNRLGQKAARQQASVVDKYQS